MYMCSLVLMSRLCCISVNLSGLISYTLLHCIAANSDYFVVFVVSIDMML